MSGFDLQGLSQYSVFNVRGEDPASLLTSYITVVALIVIAAFLSGVQLIGEPIECWCPAQTTDAMCNYTKSVCWISKQYVIDYADAIPNDPTLREAAQQREMQFYPMVPFIILILAILLKLPNFLWTAFQAEEGLNIRKAVTLAMNPDSDDEQSGSDVAYEMKFNLMKKGARHDDNPTWMSVKRVTTACMLFPMGAELGTYQTGLFLVTRLLAVVMNVLVYPLLGLVLQYDYLTWGWKLFRWVALDEEEPKMHAFPRETLCDFRIRQMQNVHAYTVQCVLPINMWSEKVFLVLWFWLLFLLLANIYSYQYWFRKLLLPDNRHALLKKHVSILSTSMGRGCPKKLTSDFTWNYMTYDSVLVLRVLEMAAGSRFTNVVVGHLWQEYNRRLLPPLPPPDHGVMYEDDLGSQD